MINSIRVELIYGFFFIPFFFFLESLGCSQKNCTFCLWRELAAWLAGLREMCLRQILCPSLKCPTNLLWSKLNRDFLVCCAAISWGFSLFWALTGALLQEQPEEGWAYEFCICPPSGPKEALWHAGLNKAFTATPPRGCQRMLWQPTWKPERL